MDISESSWRFFHAPYHRETIEHKHGIESKRFKLWRVEILKKVAFDTINSPCSPYLVTYLTLWLMSDAFYANWCTSCMNMITGFQLTIGLSVDCNCTWKLGVGPIKSSSIWAYPDAFFGLVVVQYFLPTHYMQNWEYPSCMRTYVHHELYWICLKQHCMLALYVYHACSLKSSSTIWGYPYNFFAYYTLSRKNYTIQ